MTPCGSYDPTARITLEGNVVMFRTRMAAVAATLPLVFGIAACGGAEDQQATGHLPSTPVGSTTAPPKPAQPPARLNRVTFLPAMKSALAKQKTWKMTARMTAGGRTVMTMSGVQQAKPLAMSMEMSGAAFSGGKAKIIIVRGTAYLAIPGVAPAGKYLRVDLSDPAAGEFGSLADNADPTKTFAAFDKALRNAKFVRSETIGGRKLDHYVVTVDTAAIFKAQGKPVPSGLSKTIDYHLWMDSARVIRRMTFDLAGVSMVMTMDDFNQPVTIKVPPASKIVTR